MSDEKHENCPHQNFTARVDVAIVTDQPGQYQVKGVITCTKCSKPLRFSSRMLDYFALQAVLFDEHDGKPDNLPVNKPIPSPKDQFRLAEDGTIIV